MGAAGFVQRLAHREARVERSAGVLEQELGLAAERAEGLAAQRTLLSAQQEVESAKAEHAALAASLSVLGAGGGGVGGYTLTAPLAGVVTERRVTIGKLVGGNLERQYVWSGALRIVAELDGTVDVVVSNPPYIPPDAVPIEPEVRYHDPDLALYGGGVDGLEIPRAVAATARRLLRPGGLFVMEHAEVQAEAARRMAVDAGFSEPSTIADLSGRPRALLARLSPA